MPPRQPPADYADYVPNDAGRHRRRVTDNSSDLSMSDQGDGNDFEEVARLSPSTDVMYEIRESAKMRIYELSLFDSGGNEISGDAQLRFTASDPRDHDRRVVSRTYEYNEFKNLSLRNDEEKMFIEFRVDGDEVYIPESHNWILEMDHDTAVDWSQADTNIEHDVFEWS